MTVGLVAASWVLVALGTWVTWGNRKRALAEREELDREIDRTLEGWEMSQDPLLFLRLQLASDLGLMLKYTAIAEDARDPKCLRVIIFRDVKPATIRGVLGNTLRLGLYTRAVVQVVGDEEAADRLRQLSFAEAWDLSWDVADAIVHG